jgi:hypothetical protein
MSTQRDWHASDNDVITGQVITGRDDDAGQTSGPQETFLHKVASAPGRRQDSLDDDTLDDDGPATIPADGYPAGAGTGDSVLGDHALDDGTEPAVTRQDATADAAGAGPAGYPGTDFYPDTGYPGTADPGTGSYSGSAAFPDAGYAADADPDGAALDEDAAGQDLGTTRTDIPVVTEASYPAGPDGDDASTSTGRHASTVPDGTVSNGTVSNGAVPNSTVSNGTISDGTISDGTISDGTVSDGTVPAGTVANGGMPQGGRPDDPAFAVDSDQSLLGDPTEFREQWRRVQADFVDDPRTSVTEAAGVVAGAASRLEAALRERQQTLRGSWDGNGQADTETMRQAFLMYRRLLDKLIA